jgi:hypothetical protein
MSTRLGRPPYTPEQREAAFWLRVDKDGPVHPTLGTACWVWVGATIPKGYGMFHLPDLTRKGGKRLVYTHRLMWEKVHGSIPDGRQVLHECDNPSCVNPDHLFIGTPKDNVRDMMVKGRDNFFGNKTRMRSHAHA